MQQGCVITMSRSESFKYQIINLFLEGGISRNDAALAAQYTRNRALSVWR